ncbi:MAG: hypothetical protein ACRDD7_09430 [Peptostreptococcaceae bacterium]
MRIKTLKKNIGENLYAIYSDSPEYVEIQFYSDKQEAINKADKIYESYDKIHPTSVYKLTWDCDEKEYLYSEYNIYVLAH